MSQYRNRTRSFSSANARRSQSYSSPRRGNQSRHGQYIDPAKFVKAAKPVTTLQYTPQNQFADFDVNGIIKENLGLNGYVTPTPIQDKTIQEALNGKDVIGIADTGTGKTAAFAIPVLNRLIQEPRSKVLVIAPTRELAQQIEAECRVIAKGSNIYSAILIGGTPMGPQLRDLRYNPNLVIGTPGRIKDHLERRSLNLSSFNIVILDEVDRMLDMGFVNDVRRILGQLANQRQSLFFSATLDNKVHDLIRTFSNDPVMISIKSGDTCDNVHQDVIKFSSSNEKIEKLHDLLIQNEVKKTLVFDETKHGVERLNKELGIRGFKTDAIHGNKSQGQRQRALDRFKQNEINVLVATDVAARGIDVSDITHVVNYSVPKTYDDYIHRIGRTGRAGKTGRALTFVAQ
jgi:ATP-dependent RNA helicase RhlE